MDFFYLLYRRRIYTSKLCHDSWFDRSNLYSATLLLWFVFRVGIVVAASKLSRRLLINRWAQKKAIPLYLWCRCEQGVFLAHVIAKDVVWGASISDARCVHRVSLSTRILVPLLTKANQRRMHVLILNPIQTYWTPAKIGNWHFCWAA